MKLSLLPLALLFAACGAVAEPDRLPELPTPDCDGEGLDHVCKSYAFVANTVYGVKTSCTTTPFRVTREGTYLYRENGLDGCVDVGHPGPSARCCP